MGNLAFRLRSFFSPRTDRASVKLLLLGLDYAGKTTLLYRLKLGGVIAGPSPVSFSVEEIEHRDFNLTVWDVNGRDAFRPEWKHFFPNTDGIVFVVDSSDRERVALARDEIHRLASEDELHRTAMLVFANKQDAPDVMNAEELTDRLQLQSLKDRNWHIQGVCLFTGEGLAEGLDWLTSALKKST